MISNDIIGQSPKFISALKMAQLIAPSSASVLLIGESGTGKELFAKYIHSQSNQKKGNFIAINCSAIPENLFESELFGHTKGSFTGAIEKKMGLFEEAQDGTFFLDEIGDLSLSMQAKLLRVLQEKKIKRVGENIYRPINCRIISATNKTLEIEVNEKRFREDLFYRINVIPIDVPPLRERKEDLLILAHYFLNKYATLNKSKARGFTEDATQFIIKNQWLGNVRELENTIERAVVLCDADEISEKNFLPLKRSSKPLTNQYKHFWDFNTFSIHCGNGLPTLEEVINKYIEFAVLTKGGARDKTAKEIGIDRKTLYKRLNSASGIENSIPDTA